MGESAVVLDPVLQHPQLGALRQAVERGRWAEVETYFTHWRGLDPNRLTFAAWVVAETPSAEALLDAHSPQPLARLLRAHLYVVQGWAIRTRAWAKDVSQEQWAGFRAKLVAAERELVELAALDPTDPTVAALRLTTARGLSLGLSEAERRYARLAAITPDHISGQSAHLQTTAAKWSGSSERMFAFARACIEASPPGSASGRLLAEAQLEEWSSRDRGDDIAFLQDPANRAELIAAAERSVFHPDYDPGLHSILDHSYFAAVHSEAGRPEDAEPHFRALGDTADLDAWKYFADDRGTYEKHRRAALAKGARG